MSQHPPIDEHLAAVRREHAEIAERMADPVVAGNPAAYRELASRYAELDPIVAAATELQGVDAGLADARQLAREEADPELQLMARSEIEVLEARRERLANELRSLLVPKDPDDEREVVLEVRAGTGGDEATLFAGELLRMYQRYAEANGWSFQVVDLSSSDVRGVKEAIVEIGGRNVYGRLRYESGVHRVQRVPETESQGRVHTSAATVAVLPAAEEVEIEIDEEKDLRVDSFSASGPGGQHVNRTASAVRLTHLPTGLVVQCQDEKSWHKNKARALKVLRARLHDIAMRERQSAEAAARRGQIGTGDRSEKIRTYNFPQGRVTDHRIGLTLHRLEGVLAGDLDPLVDALAEADRAARLRAELEG